ncbi:MAG TPA: ABC transporter permease [Streptosporangiaceae bacterium]|nr:ABC transporter permease [Streptosporangiaceae bacterium]
MTATQLTVPQPIRRPVRPPGVSGASGQVALRALRKYFRTPGLWIMGIVQSAMFLFSFRYVFGGAIHAGPTSYVDFLVPSYVATIVLFTGGGIAVAVAEDKVQGFTDRLLSLPVPRYSLVLGRTLADSATNLWSVVTTAAFGFLFGFRLLGSWQEGLAALGLCAVYAVVFTVVFIVMGLFAPNAQAAQGMSLIAFVFAFISSAYVPATSMPGWLQPFSKYQPITPMVDAVRSLLVGSTSDVGLALAWSALLIVMFTPIAVIRYRR